MSRESEILEVGDDGSFDISTTESVKQHHQIQHVDYDNYDWSQFNKLNNIESIEALHESEYALYKSKDLSYWVVFKSPADDTIKELLVSKKFIKISTTEGKYFDIPVPATVVIDIKSVKSKQYQNYLTVTFEEEKSSQ